MKNKFLACILCVSLLFTLFAGTVHADDSVDEVRRLVDGVLTYKTENAGADSVQAWLDGALADEAGGVEWYILALLQSGEDYDLSAYLHALGAYVTADNVPNAVTRQKYALSFLAGGVKNEFTEATAADSVGKLGIMSLVFGLHMAANGLVSEENTSASILDMLLSRQLADGGFAISGEHADADVTAMTVQALAHYSENAEVKTAIERAVMCLASLMHEDGNYANAGVVNAESTAQVIIALAALDIDIFTDARFLKNGRTLLDTLADFRLESGAFSHTEDGEANENATSQALCALIALARMQAGKTPLYDLDRADGASYSSIKQEVPAEENTPNYRVIAIAAAVLLALIACLVLFLMGKRHPKNFLAVLIVLVLVILAVLFVKIERADDYYGGETPKGEIVGTVTMTIRCDTVAGRDEHIPADGILLPLTSFAIDADDTVCDILTEAAKTYGIQLDKEGAQGLVYVSGIGYLYEFDYGDLSGWVYEVNGERASVGCDRYDLSDGDSIVWHYTVNLGNDIE